MSPNEKATRRSPPVIIDGYSESAWKSLVVKALRIGWPEELRQAASRLAPGKVQGVLLASVFEDIFPAESELADVLGEVRRGDWGALCARETHHARGYTPAFCDLEPKALEAAKTPGPLFEEARLRKVYLPKRSFNCFWTWLALVPADAGVRRALDEAPWNGMPGVMLDGHTSEGRRRGVRQFVSGHYECHRRLAGLVSAQGREFVRGAVHESEAADGELQPTLPSSS